MSKTIAMLSFEWNYEHLTNELAGINRYLKEHSDLQIYVFNAVAKYLDEEVDVSALEILNLPDISKYDGIILQGNRMWGQNKRQQVADKAHQLGIPAVSINYPLKHAIEIGTDNSTPIKDLLKQLKEKKDIHNCVFICGYSYSTEASERQRAYLEACEEYHLNNLGCLEAGWQTEDGEKAIEDYLDNGKELPDCFICANDNTARGATDILIKHGISVPQQVIVTGFDNQELAFVSDPVLTSIDRDYEGIGYTAIETLMKAVNGLSVPPVVHTPYSIKWRLNGVHESSDTSFREKFLSISKQVKNFSYVHSHYEPAMLACGKMDDLCGVLESFAKELHVKETFFTFNHGYFEYYETPDRASTYTQFLHLMAANTSTLLLQDPGSHIYKTYASSSVLPDEVKKDGSLYIVYPLHYRNTIMGCMITNGIPYGAECGFIPVYLSLVESALENVRRRYILHHINQRLDEMYVRDSLTGCYNRFGMDKFGKEYYNRCLAEKDQVFLLFADIDDMKSINDRFGHEYGDAAIRTSALLLKEAIQNNGCVIRYGGDEFLVILPGTHIPDSIHIDSYPMSVENSSFTLSLSIGETCIHTSDNIPFSQAIEKADQLMYKVKKGRKSSS